MSDRLGLFAEGEVGAGGLRAGWAADSEDVAVAEHIEFQYAGMPHQSDTALAGMWLFLASELLFFGGLFFVYGLIRARFPAGIAAASLHAELGIGTINTALLLTSSAVFAYGLGCARQGRNRALFWAAVLTFLLGAAFLGLKGYEWAQDFDKHLFPGPGFAMDGPDQGGAEQFWSFYFVATALHGLHMLVGLGLVAGTARRAWRGVYSPAYHTPVEVVGLYWSFVDMVWLLLYPMIYLAGRIGG